MALLPSETLDAAFPCRVVLDDSLTVVHAGPGLAGVAAGAPAREVLRLLQPDEPLDFTLLCACAGSEVVLENGGTAIAGLVIHDANAGVVHVLARRTDPRPVERERAATILLRELATLRESDTDQALRRILRADSEAMGIARVSYWTLQADGASITCEELYQRVDESFVGGVVLAAQDFPSYFAALATGGVIAAVDAHHDPRTREFSVSYLGPLGIGAMLDVPVFVSGVLAGVICHEHLGGPREFTAYELQIAVAVAQSLAQVLEADARRRAEAAARASEARFHQLLDVSPVPLLVTRISDGKILYASTEMTRILRADREDIMGRSSLDFYADPEQRPVIIGRLRRDGILREQELRLRRPDGSVFWSMLSVLPIEFDGDPALMCGIVDLSEHKQAEEQVRDVLRTLADRDALMTSDLARARAFQEGMLPPPLARPDVALDVLFRPVDEVSGDVYDVEVLDGGLLRLFVADATGHGVSAALTTMFLRSEYDVAGHLTRSPAGVLRALNARFARFGDRLPMHFTGVCATLDLASGLFTWSTAAHPPPCVIRDGRVRELEAGGTFVGLVPEADYPEWSTRIEPGDTVCLYSDGLTEALDRGGKPFGEARLYEALARASAAGGGLGEAALSAVTAFAGKMQDDAVLLAARWTPPPR